MATEFSSAAGAQFNPQDATGYAASGTPSTNYGNISQRTAAYAAKQMLQHAEPILVLSKFGQSKPMPKNSSDTIVFRRPVPFLVQRDDATNIADGTVKGQITKLIEGVTPTVQQMQYEDVWVKLNQYGGLVKITDIVQDLSEDPVLSDAAMLLGEQAAETIEMLTWGKICGGSVVHRASSSATPTARDDVDSVIALSQIRAVTRTLKRNRAKPVTTMMGSSVNFGTEAIEGGYIAFCHTDCEHDIRQLAGFIHLADYGSRKPLCPEEIGSVENVRFVMTPLLTPFAGEGAKVLGDGTDASTAGDAAGMVGTSDGGAGAAEIINADVYPVVIIAKHAYGLVPLKGANAITPTVLNPGTPSKSDPLGQVGFVGWKSYFAATILNESWMTRLEVTVTDL
jgi:N4-gp56 family major capsid protein